MAIAIIAEYNPFHNGHIFQIEKAKELFPEEKIIVIMSGRYVQRGEIAIASFEDRKRISLNNGVDEVIELKFEYATQAAHIFAQGAMKQVNDLGIDKIFFGSESNDINNMILIAKTINEKNEMYSKLLKAQLKNGYSFPKSASLALAQITGQSITLPNDILGLEYIKAIVNNNYNIKPYSIKRTISFHSEVPNQEFASASYIRNMIKEGRDVSLYTPMKFDNKKLDLIEDYYPEFQEIVKEMPNEELKNIKLISEGMENLFKKHIDAPSYTSFIERTNSRRYTSSRIKRTMLYVLLKIKA